MSRIGDKVKEVRISKGLTQKQLAKKLGVSESFINEVELGRKVINEALIGRISKALGQNIEDSIISLEDESIKEERLAKFNKTPLTESKRDVKEANELWSSAFASILRDIPVYDYSFSKVLSKKQLPLISNKIEGFSPDKVAYITIENDEMLGFRIDKNDLALVNITNEIINNSICLVEYKGQRTVRQIKKLDNSKVLLISNRNNVLTETVYVKDFKVIARLMKMEITL